MQLESSEADRNIQKDNLAYYQVLSQVLSVGTLSVGGKAMWECDFCVDNVKEETAQGSLVSFSPSLSGPKLPISWCDGEDEPCAIWNRKEFTIKTSKYQWFYSKNLKLTITLM